MSRAARAGWERLSDVSAGKCFQRFLHRPSGWMVIHCGHPTANYPYYAEKSGEGIIVGSYGQGWRRLNDAFDAIEGLHAGRYALDHGQGNYGKCRRVRPDRDSDWVPL